LELKNKVIFIKEDPSHKEGFFISIIFIVDENYY